MSAADDGNVQKTKARCLERRHDAWNGGKHMTAAGRQIITGIQILPQTNYGPYYFRRDIMKTIDSVMRRKDLTERIMQRMTEQGILVWSKTGRMAKVVDPEKSYKIIGRSRLCVRRRQAVRC